MTADAAESPTSIVLVVVVVAVLWWLSRSNISGSLVGGVGTAPIVPGPTPLPPGAPGLSLNDVAGLVGGGGAAVACTVAGVPALAPLCAKAGGVLAPIAVTGIKAAGRGLVAIGNDVYDVFDGNDGPKVRPGYSPPLTEAQKADLLKNWKAAPGIATPSKTPIEAHYPDGRPVETLRPWWAL